MKKKIVAVLTVFTLIFALATVSVSAKTENGVLSFNEDGKFTIVHLTDTHVHYPMPTDIKEYIVEMLDTVKPDFVVLGGDIITDVPEATAELPDPLETAVAEVVSLLTDRGIYFTLTLGNHDREYKKTGEELYEIYARCGGKYFLGSDAVPELYGEGTHDLQIMSSDGSKVAFNLFMLDSGDTVYDENGDRLGYDSVHADQIEWYKSRVAELKAENGGKTVPSLVFQHIVVQEIDDYLFYEIGTSAGDLGEEFDGKHILFTPIPKLHNMTSGVILEKPCPGYYNYGELEAMQKEGDVLAIFSGHDHSNTFTVNMGGIDVVNTGAGKHQTKFKLFTTGARVITLDENNPENYESEMLSLVELSSRDGSTILPSDRISDTDLIITKIFSVIAKMTVAFAGLFSFVG